MLDVFGSEKQAHGAKTIVGFSGVLVHVKNEALKLAQMVRLTYRRTAENLYELGSEDIYTQITPATGTLNLEYIVSTDITGNTDTSKVLANAGGCTDTGETITLQAGKAQCGGVLANVITCAGCVLTELGWSAQAGRGSFQSSAAYNVGVVA